MAAILIFHLTKLKIRDSKNDPIMDTTKNCDRVFGFPKCIAQIVAEYCMIPKLLSWINGYLLNKQYLCGNPRAIESGRIGPKYAEPEYLASNPAAADYIKNNWNKFSSKNGIGKIQNYLTGFANFILTIKWI